ncbi:NAD(P)-binding domain-containing protein [Falsiroseomonas sp. HW251]|uniref:NAD(P)-binding domain-containing protein n=1 Tax=Falsiroseomonas sp. HW251 TaxID=3390998 RepID=UPI003D31161B
MQLPPRIETLVIGGGQAGLAMSEQLSARGMPHLVLERARVAERWRSERWDGLRSLGPNWGTRIGGFAWTGSEPEGYGSRDEIVAFLDAYAKAIAAPVRCGVEVRALRATTEGGFRAETSAGAIEADNVVVATGPFQRPTWPAFAAELGGFQLHANAYRNAAQLPDGGVLVVGAGTSGVQIADELLRSGRRVFLSVGRHRRLPRRYRGHDQVWWRMEMGLWDAPAQGPGQPGSLTVSGAYGGYTIDFRDFAARGMVLLGRATDAQEGVLRCAPDLAQRIAEGDAAFLDFLDTVDRHVAATGMDAPEDPQAGALAALPPALLWPPIALDLRAEGVASVVWATGYALDFSWIGLPVLRANGQPRHEKGITPVPGLAFLGLSGLSRRNSAFFNGVAADAAHLADHLRARGPRPA